MVNHAEYVMDPRTMSFVAPYYTTVRAVIAQLPVRTFYITYHSRSYTPSGTRLMECLPACLPSCQIVRLCAAHLKLLHGN